MREFDRNRQDAMPPREPTQAMMDAAATMHTEMIVHCTRGPNYNHVWYAMYDAWQNEQTSGSTEGRAGYSRDAGTPTVPPAAGIKPGPLDHQSAATSVSDGATAAPSEATASVTDQAADPLPVAWATPSLLVTMSAVEKRRLTSPEMRGRGGEWEADARDADRYSVPLYRADALAMRERCAQVCEALKVNRPSDPLANAFDGACETCAAAVRALAA